MLSVMEWVMRRVTQTSDAVTQTHTVVKSLSVCWCPRIRVTETPAGKELLLLLLLLVIIMMMMVRQRHFIELCKSTIFFSSWRKCKLFSNTFLGRGDRSSCCTWQGNRTLTYLRKLVQSHKVIIRFPDWFLWNHCDHDFLNGKIYFFFFFFTTKLLVLSRHLNFCFGSHKTTLQECKVVWKIRRDRQIWIVHLDCNHDTLFVSQTLQTTFISEALSDSQKLLKSHEWFRPGSWYQQSGNRMDMCAGSMWLSV